MTRKRLYRKMIGRLIAMSLMAVPALAQNGATGNWSGTYSFSVQLSACSNKTFSTTGPASMTLLQTGTSISGRIDLANFLSFTGCTAGTAEVTSVIIGSAGGDAIAWSIPNDPNAAQFSGTIHDATITAQWTDANNGTGTLTFSRPTADAPAVDTSGSWSGNYTFTDRCSSRATITYSGAFTLGLTQSGANAGGVVTMQNVPLYDQNCAAITTLDMAMATSGVVSGSTFTGAVFDPFGSFEFPISATVTDSSMSGTVAGANSTNTTGTFLVTQSSATKPAADFAGTYEGTYTEADNERFTCLNIGTLTFSGAASMTIVQAGGTVSGWIVFHDALDVASDGFGGCIVVSAGDSVLPIYGTISGNAVTLDLPVGGGVIDEFMVAFAGDTVNGTVADSLGDAATFTVTRTASAYQARPRRRAVRP